MADGKKDVLDFPLEDVSVPQAIALMMQAASKIVTGTCDEQENVYLEVDDERLALLSEKLEARIEDELEKGISPTLPADTDEPDIYQSTLDDEVVKLMVDDQPYQVIVNGVVFGKLCNERVYFDPDMNLSTSCCKEWGHHEPMHEDKNGNKR